MFITRCDDCGLYASDEDAAEAISAITGWPILKSYDRDDEVDPVGRAEKQGTDYYRPYFKVTLLQAVEVVSR